MLPPLRAAMPRLHGSQHSVVDITATPEIAIIFGMPKRIAGAEEYAKDKTIQSLNLTAKNEQILQRG
jgi:hypothetical protein